MSNPFLNYLIPNSETPLRGTPIPSDFSKSESVHSPKVPSCPINSKSGSSNGFFDRIQHILEEPSSVVTPTPSAGKIEVDAVWA